MIYKIIIDPSVMEFTIDAETFEEAEQEALDVVLQHWEVEIEDEEILQNRIKCNKYSMGKL